MVIRIFNPIDGTQIQELRRGLEYAQIYSLSFDHTERHLAMSCDSGSIHIYNLKQTKQEFFLIKKGIIFKIFNNERKKEAEKAASNECKEYQEKDPKNPTSK